MRSPHPVALALTLLVVLASAPASAATASPSRDESLVTASDVLKVQQLGGPALSPDGQWILYTVKTMAEKPDKPGEYIYHDRLWLAATNGHTAPRELTHGEAGATSPHWSPDSRRVAFVRNEKDKPQIWILPLADGGEAWMLTKFESGATGPQWSPDGKSLAFLANLSATEVRKELEKTHAARTQPEWSSERARRTPGDTGDWFDKDKEAKKPAANPDGTVQEQRDWLAKDAADGNPRLITRLNFIGESDLQPQLTFTSLYVTEVREGASPRALAPGYRSVSSAAWSPDSRRLVYSVTPAGDRHPDRDLSRDLEWVNADGTGHGVLLKGQTHALLSPRFSPDGKIVVFLSQDVVEHLTYSQVRVGFMPAGDASAPWYVEKFDRSAQNPVWAPDSRHVYFTAASNGGFPLYRVAAAPNAKVERLTDFSTGVDTFDVGHSHLAYILTKAANPFELYAADLDVKEPHILTTHNSEWLHAKQVSLPEHRTITRPDGRVIDVWLLKPANFDPARKYPLLLEIHGGPSAMWGPGEATMWHEFQFFAARGYGIVFCNPRGSGGYGYDFQHANYQNWGPGPGSDILAAADLAAKEPWVDPARQVVTGGSYGGYMTAWLITQDHRFKAAVAVRGVYDLCTFFGEGNAWQLVPAHFGGYPWQPEIRAILQANSPVTFVHQITTPLLIKHGDNDLRTGPVQSEMLYKSLKVLERPVEYARYPHATHELSRSGDPRQRLDRVVRFDEFFRRFIGEN